MSDLATQQPRVAGPSSKRSPKFKPPRVPASLTNGPWPTLEGPEKERRPKRQPYGEKDAGDEALLRGRHLKALLFAHGGFMSARGHKRGSLSQACPNTAGAAISPPPGGRSPPRPVAVSLRLSTPFLPFAGEIDCTRPSLGAMRGRRGLTSASTRAPAAAPRRSERVSSWLPPRHASWREKDALRGFQCARRPN